MIEKVTQFLESILPGITTLSISSLPFLIFAVVFSILFCTVGYRLFRVLIGVWGAVLGAWVGLQIASLFTDTWWIGLIAAIVGAALICLAAVYLYYVSIFITIAVPVAVLCAGMLVVWIPQLNTLYVCIIAIAAGILFGLLAALVKKPVIIITTAICGAFGCVSAFWQLAANLFHMTEDAAGAFGTSQTGLYLHIAAGVLALIGLIIQFVTTRGYRWK